MPLASERRANVNMESNVIYTEKVVPAELTDLSDGEYDGMWGGYTATVTVDNTTYRIHTKEGIRTPSMPCKVIVKGGIVKVVA